jgi:hypothetical protein
MFWASTAHHQEVRYMCVANGTSKTTVSEPGLLIVIFPVINHSGDIGPFYRKSFRVQRGHGTGSFFRRLFHIVKPLLYSGTNAVGKEALKTGINYN